MKYRIYMDFSVSKSISDITLDLANELIMQLPIIIDWTHDVLALYLKT